jgi:dynein assembly factor 2, axonemal
LSRINASILGQKKKNERKTRNKKRAQERRASESENSEGDCEREKRQVKTIVDEKLSSSGDEAADKVVPPYEGRPTACDTVQEETDTGIPIKNQKSQAKNKNKKKNGKGGKQKHASLNIEQLGFKNDLIFDLDM